MFSILPVDVINDTVTVLMQRLQEAYTSISEQQKLNKEEQDTLEQLTREQHESDV